MSDDKATESPGTDTDGAVRALILLAAKLVSACGPCEVLDPRPTTDAPTLRVLARTPNSGVVRERRIIVRKGAFAWAETERRTIAPLTNLARAVRIIEHVLVGPDLTPSTVHLPAATPGSSSDTGHSHDPPQQQKPAPARRPTRWRPPLSDLNEPAGTDTTRPGIARVYDYFLGGKDNYDADRAFAGELENANPHVRQLVRDNRYFLSRAVCHLVRDVGIGQFLDIGTGLPTQDNVHEVAQRDAPDARVVYVDNDPMVLAHARALLAGTSPGTTDYIDADAGDTRAILTRAAATLNLDRPVALLLVATLHFIQDAEAVVTPLREALPPGSHLVITHAVDRPDFRRIGDLYQRETNRGYLRTPDQIAELFGDWEMVEPGLVDLPDWHPEILERPSPAAGLFLGGVARKAKPW